MTEPIHLLIADDHPIIRAGLRGMLEAQPDFEVVGEATTGVEAVELTARLHPKVVLMDLRMPELDGVAAITQIKAKHPETYVLVVTTYDSDADILRAIEAGATGYLLKDAPREELFQAIRAVAQGKPLLAPAVAAHLMEKVQGPSEEAPDGREIEAHMLRARGADNNEGSASPRQVANVPTGTVTFLFTDIEGSTSMWENYPTQMEAALARHDEILRTAVEARGGYVFKTVGDAFCAAFSTAKEGLEATLAAQRAFFAEEWDENAALRVRMALHTGVAEERDGDYFGPPVNRVARLLSAGHGGQILLSAVTYGLVRDNLDFVEPKAELKDLGEHRLKDLRHAEHIYQLAVPDLPADFPALKTLDTRSDERYGLKHLIGSGGMAEVYLAHDWELDRDVAFKVLRNEYADDEQFVERFQREARNAASLSHPNIVSIYDRGKTDDGSYYIVMEYVVGDTLKERIHKEGSLPPPMAVAIALQMARALRAAHERGVIHRDIKPQNVLLTESGETKVTDFGIARAVSSSTMTKVGSLMGTAHYISPEQAMGETATPQSDLYSLGVVLYEMLTGEVPHDAETPVGIAMKHVSGELRSPKEVNPRVPEDVNAVTMRLLARDPKDRYQDAGELIDDLERVKQGTPPALPAEEAVAGRMGSRPSAGRGGPASRSWSPLKVLMATGLAGVAALVVIGLAVWALVPYSQDENIAAEPPKPAPGYDLIEHDSGAFWVEVPSEWNEHIMVDSEGEKGRAAWSSFLGEGESVGPSMTAVNDLDSWRTGTVGHQGIYMVASKRLAQRYTDDELVASGPNDYSSSCQAGTPQDFDRSPYSGKIMQWKNCGGDSDHAATTLAIAPKGRECVLVAQIGGYFRTQTDQESIRHILDTLEADCDRLD